MGEKGEDIPKILEQRALINEENRELLRVMEELSPRDTGQLYLVSNLLENGIPTVQQIAKKLNIPKERILDQLEKIRKCWGLPEPEDLPTRNGFFDREEALISALVNQHKLRWDETMNNYRVPRMHMISGEMGTGTLYTATDAFQGEKLARRALGLDECLSSYLIQGGIMPPIILMFGKRKNNQALLTGMNKSAKTPDNKEFELIKQELELLRSQLGKKPLTQREIEKLKKHVINTINSMEEAAISVAYELVPFFENASPYTQYHFFMSYNDDANKSEIEDQHIAILRSIHNLMGDASTKLPALEKRILETKRAKIKKRVEAILIEDLCEYLTNLKTEIGEDNFKERGKEFLLYLGGFNKQKRNISDLEKELLDGAESISAQELREYVRETQGRINDELTTMKRVKRYKENIEKAIRRLGAQEEEDENRVSEIRAFANSHLTEKLEGHSWFTKKIALSPTEAKALETIKKEIYKALYTDLMIPKIKELVGKELDIKLHTDNIITVEIPDPEYLVHGDKSPNRPIGTLITSHPRTNDQLSNEPLLETLKRLQKFHEGEVSLAIKTQRRKPKTKKEFNKRNFAFSDVYVTSWGGDGFRCQRKFGIDPGTVMGEYTEPEGIATYIKVPSRHDRNVLGELMVRGNKRTWEGKRIAKGGTTMGPVLYIEHPDQSTEIIFFDDDYLKSLWKKYGAVYTLLEQQEKDAKKQIFEKKNKRGFKKSLEQLSVIQDQQKKLLEKIKPQIWNVFLQNDMHLGSFSKPGRPSNLDVITSSQLAALQTYGTNGFSISLMSEVLHGEQAWRSYDSKRETETNNTLTISNDPTSFMKRLSILEKKLKESGANDQQILESVKMYTEEFLRGHAIFKPEEQKQIFREVLQPINEELMNNGVPLFVGAGNHWMAKPASEDEANVIASMFDRKYANQKMLRRGQSSAGQGFTYETIKLPSFDGNGINAVFAHKMWHGATEISSLASQMNSARENAIYCFTADRHHPGLFAEQGKMGVLDIGKQPTIAYRRMIGKAASTNGTMVARYGGNNELLIGARHFDNPVIEQISGWDYRAGVLAKATRLIEDGSIDLSRKEEEKTARYLIDRRKQKRG